MEIDGWEETSMNDYLFAIIFHSIDDHEKQLASSWSHSKIQKWLEPFSPEGHDHILKLLLRIQRELLTGAEECILESKIRILDHYTMYWYWRCG